MSLSKHLTTGRMIPSGTNTPPAEVSIYDPDYFPSWTVQLNIQLVFPFLFLAHTHLFGYIFGKTRKTNHHILYINRVSILLMCVDHFHDCFLSPVQRQESVRSCICVPGYRFCFYLRFVNWISEPFQQFCIVFYYYLLGMPDQRGISLTYLLTNHF